MNKWDCLAHIATKIAQSGSTATRVELREMYERILAHKEDGLLETRKE